MENITEIKKSMNGLNSKLYRTENLRVLNKILIILDLKKR